MLTVPDGSAESFTDDIDWIACNLEHPIYKWSTAISRAQIRNIVVMPWVRLAHVNLGDTIENVRDKLRLLVDTARIWNTDWILPNYEDEAVTIPPAAVAQALAATGWDKNTGWSTQGWIPNGVDYSPMGNDPCLLQIFPTDLHWPKDYATIKQKMSDCCYHAREGGFKYVGVTYQTYDGATPDWYDVNSFMHSVYPGNIIQHGEWPKWFP